MLLHTALQLVIVRPQTKTLPQDTPLFQRLPRPGRWVVRILVSRLMEHDHKKQRTKPNEAERNEARLDVVSLVHLFDPLVGLPLWVDHQGPSGTLRHQNSRVRRHLRKRSEMNAHVTIDAVRSFARR